MWFCLILYVYFFIDIIRLSIYLFTCCCFWWREVGNGVRVHRAKSPDLTNDNCGEENSLKSTRDEQINLVTLPPVSSLSRLIVFQKRYLCTKKGEKFGVAISTGRSCLVRQGRLGRGNLKLVCLPQAETAKCSLASQWFSRPFTNLKIRQNVILVTCSTATTSGT